MSTATDIFSALSTMFSAGGPAAISALNAIGTHMQGTATTNQSVGDLLTQMQSNPANAATYAALIVSLPNVPAGVKTEVEGAVALASNQIAYVQAIIAAKQALNQANSTSALGGLLAGLSLPAA